ncbi:hypothetical protein GCM10022232_64360 [Streptomyces plumbiresistens]|uniref:Uncharacterized protein n=1 Tax=Streptomyces plumbiresistens TaxID=511811 RepID=A0ABP7SLQ7_9ACTN
MSVGTLGYGNLPGPQEGIALRGLLRVELNRHRPDRQGSVHEGDDVFYALRLVGVEQFGIRSATQHEIQLQGEVHGVPHRRAGVPAQEYPAHAERARVLRPEAVNDAVGNPNAVAGDSELLFQEGITEVVVKQLLVAQVLGHDAGTGAATAGAVRPRHPGSGEVEVNGVLRFGHLAIDDVEIGEYPAVLVGVDHLQGYAQGGVHEAGDPTHPGVIARHDDLFGLRPPEVAPEATGDHPHPVTEILDPDHLAVPPDVHGRATADPLLHGRLDVGLMEAQHGRLPADRAIQVGQQDDLAVQCAHPRQPAMHGGFFEDHHTGTRLAGERRQHLPAQPEPDDRDISIDVHPPSYFPVGRSAAAWPSAPPRRLSAASEDTEMFKKLSSTPLPRTASRTFGPLCGPRVISSRHYATASADTCRSQPSGRVAPPTVGVRAVLQRHVLADAQSLGSCQLTR